MNRFKNAFEPDFLKTILRTAFPIAMQFFLASAVNLIDVVMIGSLGDVAVSGVYMGGQIQTILQVAGAGIEAAPWSERDRLVGEAGLIVNTTSLGMKGQPPLEISLDGLKRGAVVADIVYVPLRTPLIEAAALCAIRTGGAAA